jgi:hypothetical protein
VSGRFLRALRFPGTYDPGVAPLLLGLAGALALAAAVGIQRGFGPRGRVGRLLAVAPKVSIAEAIRLADAGAAAYVRVDGRIDSHAEFEDEAHRPLVVRRTTIDWRPEPGNEPWRRVRSDMEHVPFVIREGMDEIAVDGASLAEGLIVVPREWRGSVAELGEGTPAEAPADAQARVVIEQASSVEHGSVIGVPKRVPGGVSMGPGLGRPLIMTTLEDDEAMRVLTGGAANRARAAIVLLALGALLLAGAVLWGVLDWLFRGPAAALAATPAPSLRPGSDTRTTGGGPGLVGDPLLALLVVLGVATLSVIATLAYVRLTGGARPPRSEGKPKPW